jgi:sulfur relay (sulfurtransferase) complex TusBCD TusD component (DsrE family)
LAHGWGGPVCFIINDGPYGNERAYNALRLALNLVKSLAHRGAVAT